MPKEADMEYSNSELLNLYSNTVFLLDEVQALPNPFAIITAFNPQGKSQPLKQNESQNEALRSELENVLHHTVIGASPDLTHQEPSFIVQISKPAAVGLAHKYDQNAIFWVEGDELHLVPVLMQGDEVSIGQFRERIRLGSESN